MDLPGASYELRSYDDLLQELSDARKEIIKLKETEKSLVYTVQSERNRFSHLFETKEGNQILLEFVVSLIRKDIGNSASMLEDETKHVSEKNYWSIKFLDPSFNLARFRETSPSLCRLFEEIAKPLSSSSKSPSAVEVAYFSSTSLRVWLVLSHVISSIFPSWRSRFFFKINEGIMKERNVAAAATTHMLLSPASFTHDWQQQLGKKQLSKDVQKDPTFDLNKYFIVGQYDNIQLIKKQTNETGAGSLGKKKNLVQVRTARMMMQVQNSEWAKLQKGYKHKPGVMAKAYPLADVPRDCIKISAISASDNPDNHSDATYLELEYLFNMKLAVEIVLKKFHACF